VKRLHIAPVLVLSCALAGWACGRSDAPASEPGAPSAPEPVAQAPAAPAVLVAPAPAAPAAPAAPPSDRVDDPSFELRLAPAGSYAAGKVGSFALTIKPRGEWHLNQDFPTQVSVRGAPEIAFPSAKLTKQAAAEFGDHLARFDVPFTASAAGSHTVTCDVKFAVCSDANCIPEERTLAVALRVD
jgi:hypothetical protein